MPGLWRTIASRLFILYRRSVISPTPLMDVVQRVMRNLVRLALPPSPNTICASETFRGNSAGVN
jgi:hypothetical protein